MPVTDRTLIIRGPASVSFVSTATTVFTPNNDIIVKISRETFDIVTSTYGKMQQRIKEWKVEITFTPVGEFTEALAAPLWPYAGHYVGQSLVGKPAAAGTDQTLSILPLRTSAANPGYPIVFSNVFIKKMPDIILSSIRTMIGPVTMECLCKKASDRTTAEDLFKIATSAAAATAITGFTTAEVLTQPWKVSWGAEGAGIAGFSVTGGFASKEGIVVSFDTSMEAVETDNLGIVDYIMTDQMVTATCIPVPNAAGSTCTEVQLTAAMAPADVVGARGTPLAEGELASAAGHDLIITGLTSAQVVTLKRATVKDYSLQYGNVNTRLGDVTWQANRVLTSGVPGVWFSITTP